jgi:hypothetical protein
VLQSGRKVASARTMMVKAVRSKLAPGVEVAPWFGAPPNTVASTSTSVSKVAMTITSPRAGVLTISTGLKRLVAALLLTVKGKQAKVTAGAPSSSVQPRVTAEPDDDRVAYCAILDSVPLESSFSLGETSGSMSILPPIYSGVKLVCFSRAFADDGGTRS